MCSTICRQRRCLWAAEVDRGPMLVPIEALMRTRTFFMLFAILGGCSCGGHETASSTTPEPSPVAPEPEPVAPTEPVVVAEPSPVATSGEDRCEGLVGGCGGWLGCVLVRVDPTGPGRFVGVGPDVGHLYDENHQCHGGVCNEICSGGSGNVCRPGLTERVPIACSGAHAPSNAPFTCWMRDGACVQGPDPTMMPAS